MAKKTSIEHYREAVQELESGELKPVYFFSGEEEFFLDRLQEKVENTLAPENRDFNVDLLYGREVTPEQVLSIARSYPMMADRRLVILRDFSSLNDQEENGGELNDFIGYFEQPNPSTLLVCIDSSKPSGNTRIGKAIKKNKNVGYYEFEAVPDYRLPDWIIDWVRHHYDKKIDPASARVLAQYVGNSLQLLSTEIDKVCTFVDTRETITQSDVKKIIGLYREYTVFELQEALVSRDLDQTLFIVEQILHHSKNDTGEIIRTVGFFYNQFSYTWQILRLAAAGNTKQQVQESLGVGNSWYFNKLWQDASRFTLDDMPRVFEALLDADRAAKGFSTMDPATIFLLMVRRIIN